MVDYRISLDELTEGEINALLNAVSELKSFNVNKRTIIFLMQEMNRMYGKNVYTEKDLSCSDCINNIKRFWQKWSVSIN